MAKSNSDHTVKLNADFSDFVRQAKKAGEKSADLLSKAIEAGVKTSTYKAYKKSVKDYSKMRAEAEQTASALQYALAAKQANKVGAKLKKTAEEIARLTSELNDANLDDDMKKRKKAERAFFQEKCKLLDRLNSNSSETLKDDSAALRTSMAKMNREMTISNVRMGVNVKLAKVTSLMMGEGAKEFNEGVEGALTRFKDGLQNIDVGAMLSGGITSAGKQMGGIAETLVTFGKGMGGSIGGLAEALGGVALVLGPLIIAFGLFAGVMFGIDKEVKEFNKSAINTFGTRSVVSLGAGNMRDGLTVLRHATQDLNKTLGLTSEEAMGVFDAFDAGGISLNRLTQGAVTAADKEKALGEVLRETASTAKALGVGVSEFTTNLAEYSNDLATSLENVTDQFALVSKQAGDAGFSTRRFYSLITQAASGQASLNTHLSTTGDLLIKMSKAIGDKAAAEMIGGAAGSFKEMGTQERYKTLMTTGGGRAKGIIKGSAERQASTFTADLKELGDNSELAKSLKMARDAGVQLSDDALSDVSGEKLVKELSSMTREQQSTLMASLSSSSDKTVSGLGRRLDQLTTVSRGTTGGMADMSDALSGLDPGAAIAMKLSSAMAILGRPLDELTGVDRMAAESITGLTGSQMEQYQALARVSKGNFALLEGTANSMKTLSEEDRTKLQEDQDKRFGAHMDENGKVVTKSGAEISNAMELMSASVEASPTEIADVKDENVVLAEDALDETMTISDVLQNEITQLLRGIYEDVGLPLIDLVADLVQKWLGGPSREERHAAKEMRGTLTKSIRGAGTEKSTAERTVAKLSRKKEADRTPEEKAALEDAQVQIEMADAVIAASEAALTRLSSGDTSALTMTEYAGPRGVYQSREAADRSLTVDERNRMHEGSGPGLMGSGEYIEERKTAIGGSTAAGAITSAARSEVVTRRRHEREAAADAVDAADAARVASGGRPPVTTAPTTAPITPEAAREILGSPTGALTGSARIASDAMTGTATPAPTAPTMAGGRAADDAAAAVHEPIVAAAEAHTAETIAQGEATRATLETTSTEGTKAVVKALTKDVKLGNALARSNLPDAIVAAQVKQQITALASAAGLSGEDADTAISEYMEKGTFSTKLTEAFGAGMDDATRSALSSSAASLGGFAGGKTSTGISVAARGSHSRRRAVEDEVEAADTDVATVLPPAHDFLYRGDGVRGTITPIDTADDVMGMKGGGPIDRAMGGSGGSVTVNIYGGDERRVFDVVKRVLQQSGIGPGRVTSRA